MQTFEFSGFGNFSTNFGWDNGLQIEVIGELPDVGMTSCIEATDNSHNGSRNVYGMVTARNKYRANRMVKAWAKRMYPITEYAD